jgi:uncharacterized protein (DUF427 family)
VDAWFEEDEEVFTHPRDPHTRVDVLPSSRHVRVEVDGLTIAESASPRLLFETGLPVRYYLPKTHVRMDLLMPTDTVTHCPYKGQAEYWSVRAGDQVHEALGGRIRPRCPRARRPPGWSPSTTRRSTSTSTACGRNNHPPSSAEAAQPSVPDATKSATRMNTRSAGRGTSTWRRRW